MELDQNKIIKEAQDCIVNFGLKRWYVAAQCGIPQTLFSSWLNHNATIRPDQVIAVKNFVVDYKCRMA